MERLTEKITDKNTKEVLAYRAKCHKDLEAIQKLGKLEDLEEQEKLLKLSCTVGSIVYALWSIPTEQRYVIYPAEVKEICFGKYANRRTIQYRLEPISYRGIILKFYQDDFGKKLFLEESEAEAALQEMNEMEGKENV